MSHKAGEDILLSVKYDYHGQTSFHNYIERLDLKCADHETIGLLGSMFFIGWAMSSLFVARLGDTLGRKKVFVAALSAQVVLITILINSRYLYLSMAALF